MKFSTGAFSFPVIASVLILSSASSPVAQAYVQPEQSLEIAGLLRRDLKAIRSGSQPTEGQIQTLSADLGKLFSEVEHPPTATLDYLAAKLAAATAQGRLSTDNLRAVAHKLAFFLSGDPSLGEGKISSLESILSKAGAKRSEINQVVAALRVLPASFLREYESNSTGIELKNLSAGSRGYLHPRSIVYLESYRGQLATGDGKMHRFLVVNVSQVPRGKYHAGVTTKTKDQPVDLGIFLVRKVHALVTPAMGVDAPGTADHPATSTDDTDDGSDDSTDTSPLDTGDPAVQGSGGMTATAVSAASGPVAVPSSDRVGSVTFSDEPYNQPLPVGLSLEDVTGIVITDKQGVQRLTGSFLDPAAADTARTLNVHFVAKPAAPTAQGEIALTVFRDRFQYQNDSFRLTAGGLPANAALTLSVDGKPVEQMTTDSTGNLLVEARKVGSPDLPKGKGMMNPLFNTVDLFTAESFTVSDAQGNVLASAGF